MKRGKWVALTLSTWVSGAAMGAGFQLYTEGSAEALGQAGAISARKGMTSQAWYNPSALAGTERPQIMIGSAFVSLHTDYKNDAAPATNESMSDEWRVIPHLYYVQPLSDQLTGTLSINAPYGLITEWDDDWVGRELATYSELRTVYITPSVAWQAFDMLSISAGLNIVDADAELSRYDSAPPAGPPGESTVKGDDINYGGTFSAHLQPVENWALGFRYQSQVKLDVTGSATIPAASFPASAEVVLPSSINLGLANTSLGNLSLGLDLVWTEWSTYDDLTVVTPAGATTVEKNWEDVISIRFGGEYAIGEDWKIRAGYIWDESPVPDDTRSPEMPGSDRQMVTMGFGWQFWDTMTLDAAYSYLWAKEANMGTDITGVAPGLAGTFETTTHLLALSLGYTF